VVVSCLIAVRGAGVAVLKGAGLLGAGDAGATAEITQ
jgi:hypothetical protein